MKFVKFDPETGKILFSGDVPEEMIAAQGGNVVVGQGNSDTHYVDIARKILVEFPQKPSNHHEWCHITKRWLLNQDAAWKSVRAQRDRLLSECDWTQLRDIPLKKKLQWKPYRQALRDITKQSDPANIIWPDPPPSN